MVFGDFWSPISREWWQFEHCNLIDRSYLDEHFFLTILELNVSHRAVNMKTRSFSCLSATRIRFNKKSE